MQISETFTYDITQLFLDVTPNLPVLEVGVELNDLHALLLALSKVVQVKSHSVEGSEDGESQIIAQGLLVHQFVQDCLWVAPLHGLSRLQRLFQSKKFIKILSYVFDALEALSYARLLVRFDLELLL